MGKAIYCDPNFKSKDEEYEQQLLILTQAFEKNLDEKWEIYILPFINGKCPDLVLLHPQKGIMFWELVLPRDNLHRCYRWVKDCRDSTIQLYSPIL